MSNRFTLNEIDNFDHGIKVTEIILDNGIELSQSTVCDLLNQLTGENELLNQQVGNDYNEANSLSVKIADLTKKNEHLKRGIALFQEKI